MPGVQEVLEVLRRRGVTHVVGLPDNGTAPLFHRLAEAAPAAPRLVRVTREGEAFALAAGLWMGGAVPFVVVQNTGLLESGDGLRGTAARMRVPLVMLVGYRGYRGALAADVDLEEGAGDAELLSRLGLDSAALATRATLRAWGIPHRLAAAAELPGELEGAFEAAAAESRPVAVLLTDALEAAP